MTRSEQKDTALLISYARSLGNGAIFKRLGFLAERFAKDEKNLIEACRSRLSAGNAKLDTSLPADRLITRWKLWVPEAWAREMKEELTRMEKDLQLGGGPYYRSRDELHERN